MEREMRDLSLKQREIREEIKHFSLKYGGIKREIRDISANQEVKINSSQSLPF